MSPGLARIWRSPRLWAAPAWLILVLMAGCFGLFKRSQHVLEEKHRPPPLAS